MAKGDVKHWITGENIIAGILIVLGLFGLAFSLGYDTRPFYQPVLYIALAIGFLATSVSVSKLKASVRGTYSKEDFITMVLTGIGVFILLFPGVGGLPFIYNTAFVGNAGRNFIQNSGTIVNIISLVAGIYLLRRNK